MRRWLPSILLLLIGLPLGLLLAAGAELEAPWLPDQRQAFAPAILDAVGARAEASSGDSIEFVGSDALGRSLLIARDLDLEAAHWDFLAYRFDSFPATLKLVLVWRSSEAPGRLRSLPLPRPSTHAQRVGLQDVPGWEGRLSELGLLVLPADLLPAEATLERRFALRQLALESGSRTGALAALFTEWSAYRPWVGRSINTAGFELGSPQRQTLLWFALALGLTVAIAAWLVWRPRLRLVTAVALALLAAWVGLDLHQLAQLHWRGDFTRWARHGSEEIQVDPGLASVLGELQPLLRELDPRLVLVSGGTAFHRTYGAFRLLPLPVAVVESAPELPSGEQRLALVLIGATDTRFDRDAGRLFWGGRSFAAEALFEVAPVQAYRLLDGQAQEEGP